MRNAWPRVSVNDVPDSWINDNVLPGGLNMKMRSATLLWRVVTIAIAALLASCQSTTPLTWKVPDGVTTMQVNGYPMAYTEVGSGPKVVLVHGVMCDYRCWGTTPSALSGDFRMVAVSLRHFYPEVWDGASGTFSVAQHAKDLAAFIEKLGPPVSLVGHSYGGFVASEVARARPELITKLVLAEASTEYLLPPPSDEQRARKQKFGEATEDALKTRGKDAGLEFAVDTLNGKGAWSRYPASIQSFHRDNAWTMVGAVRDTTQPVATCADFGSLKMPVLLVTGENTAPRYKQFIAAQTKCLPSAKTAVMPNASHGMIGSPAFQPALRDFLK